MRPISFYLLTDAHYLSKTCWTRGEPITFRERSDQIALTATPDILDAFIEAVLADTETDTVLFCGDNVDSGDMASHYEFRERLERLTGAGKRVFVIYATHDYCGAGEDNNRFESRRYTATGTEPIPFMKKDGLFPFYYEYGPKQARSVHRESGSYTVQLGEGVRLVALIDNGDGGGFCGLYEDGMRWLKQELQSAREDGDFVLLATHHPVLPPWDVYGHAAAREMFGGCRELRECLCAENVRAVFTGHTHVQSIRKYTDAQGRWLLDIGTIALANAFGKMRKVEIDAAQARCHVTSAESGRKDFEALYYCNFPGIWERLLPLAGSDTQAFFAQARGYLPVEKLKKAAPLIRLAGKRLQAMKLSAAAKHGRVWRTLSPAQRQEAREKRLADTVAVILRHLYTGNAPFTPDTVENKIVSGLARRADRLARLLRIKAVGKLLPAGASLCGTAQDFLYNTRTGDDDEILFSLQ